MLPLQVLTIKWRIHSNSHLIEKEESLPDTRIQITFYISVVINNWSELLCNGLNSGNRFHMLAITSQRIN